MPSILLQLCRNHSGSFIYHSHSNSGGTAVLTADANGTVMTGDYDVTPGDDASDLNISSFAATSAVTDVYGNTLNSLTLQRTSHHLQVI